MRVSLAQVKPITNHTVSQAFVSWLPSSCFDVRALVAAQHGSISSSSVCVDPQGIAFLEDAHHRPPLHPFSDDGGLCRDSHNGLHSFWSRCSIRSSNCATIVIFPGALDCPRQCVVCTPQVYLDGIWVACVASPSVRSGRLETRTRGLCSIGTYTNRHSTCTCTLQVSLRDSVAPPSTSVRLSKSRSSCIRGSAWPVVTHPVTLCANCRH